MTNLMNNSYYYASYKAPESNWCHEQQELSSSSNSN
jgi:hypothetical protein